MQRIAAFRSLVHVSKFRAGGGHASNVQHSGHEEHKAPPLRADQLREEDLDPLRDFTNLKPSEKESFLSTAYLLPRVKPYDLIPYV